MIAFAGNSLFCRAALRSNSIDAASFTAIRLATGAAVLAMLVVARRSPPPSSSSLRGEGTWTSAAALAAYAVAFSFAYLRIGAAAGALILFGSVQLTMIAGGLLRGERPSPQQWLGWLVALAGLIVINAPRLDPPSPLGAALMVIAGIAWGIYSLRGRGIERPLIATAGNFVRSVPAAALLIAIAFATHGHATPKGIALAAASGGIASGIGYSLWYAAVPALGAHRAAVVQLSVPVITALAAVTLLGEAMTTTLLAGAAAIVGGLALALIAPRSSGRSR
ncbi:MAG TPA: DMT family transporter [Kofleriaceae bacterium]|nr:DMT family transporter [Kofleriaceae bacterium]